MTLQRVFGLALVGLLCSGCVTRAAYQEKLDELYTTKSQLKRLEEMVQDYGSQVSSLKNEKDALSRENGLLRSTNEDANRQLEEMRRRVEELNAMAIEGVTAEFKDGAFVYRIEDRVLFDSGRAELKPSAKQTLSKLASLLQQNQLKIEVAGHTDTDPVKVSKDKWQHNMGLGAARAIAVWDELKSTGIPAQRMHIASYGEYDPIDSAKEKNRRVEVRLLLADPTAAQ